MNELDLLSLKHGTDKGPQFHNYTKHYFSYFFPIKDTARNILEIGVHRAASLKMWAEFFEQATIYGVDTDPVCSKFEAGRIKIIISAQADKGLPALLAGISFNLIIDDGSHLTSDQITSFHLLFPLLRPGGLYVVEDTCTSYWPPFINSQPAVDFFKDMTDSVAFHGKRIPNSDCRNPDKIIEAYPTLSYHEKNIESIHFYGSFIIVIKR